VHALLLQVLQKEKIEKEVKAKKADKEEDHHPINAVVVQEGDLIVMQT